MAELGLTTCFRLAQLKINRRPSARVLMVDAHARKTVSHFANADKEAMPPLRLPSVNLCRKISTPEVIVFNATPENWITKRT